MLIKRNLKKLVMFFIINFDKLMYITKFKNPPKEKVIFISERNDWAIKYVGQNISDLINKKCIDFIKIISSPKYYQNKVIHFGSQYMWVDWYEFLPKNNFYVVSFFHGKKEDGQEVEKHINAFLNSINFISIIIVSCKIVKNRLLGWGIPSYKIVLIPIGVNNTLFTPTKTVRKNCIREQFGIKKSSIVIGSFQKDGIGWEQGHIPKLIKGPDIFIKVVRLLKNQGYDITILLTGPARGYIKNELTKINVSYIHKYFKKQSDLLKFYHALDVYLITSREEGGPMGLMEAMASGIPVVSTPVGMSLDLIKNNHSGKISNNFDYKNIANLFKDLIEDDKLNKVIVKNALQVVDTVSWINISKQYYEGVYLQLLKDKI